MEVVLKTGELNIQVTLQAKTAGQDSYGQPTPDVWSDIKSVWAKMVQTEASEFYYAQKTYSEITAVFKTHFLNGLNAMMRIKYGNRYFEIIGVDNIEQRNAILLIMAKEVL
jgi:SPP1 family predicted phage head-tail adaptor